LRTKPTDETPHQKRGFFTGIYSRLCVQGVYFPSALLFFASHKFSISFIMDENVFFELD
jgi:hypothetical protein